MSATGQLEVTLADEIVDWRPRASRTDKPEFDLLGGEQRVQQS